MEIAVLGKSEFTLGFMLAGIQRIHTVERNPEKAIDQLMQEKDVGIIIIDSAVLDNLDEKTQESVERSVKPVFVPVSTEASQENLRKMIIKSIGVDLMAEK
jgi:V/A-type H+/Na+-transporting ATPase subunit F